MPLAKASAASVVVIPSDTRGPTQHTQEVLTHAPARPDTHWALAHTQQALPPHAQARPADTQALPPPHAQASPDTHWALLPHAQAHPAADTQAALLPPGFPSYYTNPEYCLELQPAGPPHGGGGGTTGSVRRPIDDGHCANTYLSPQQAAALPSPPPLCCWPCWPWARSPRWPSQKLPAPAPGGSRRWACTRRPPYHEHEWRQALPSCYCHQQ